MRILLDSPAAVHRLRTMPTAFMPMRRPNWNDPPLWSLPLTQTAIVSVPGNSVWTPVLNVTGIPGFIAVINKFVLTAYLPNALAGINTRLIYNGRFTDSIQLVGSGEYNRTTPTSWPTHGRQTFFALVNGNDSVQLQVQNTGVFQQLILAAFYGWYANVDDQAERATVQGMGDA
jgi:hypothetical protein